MDSVSNTMRRKVILRYILQATVAVLLTLTCPDTLLWKTTTSTTSPPTTSPTESSRRKGYLDSLDRPFCAIRLVVLYITTLLFLVFVLQGSNPGYLTPTHMQYLDDLEAVIPMSTPTKTDLTMATEKGQEEKLYMDTAPQDGVNKIDDESAVVLDQQADDTVQDALLSHTDELEASVPRKPTRRPPCRHCPSNVMSDPPLRSHHCKRCNRHVATFDHHCVFIETCIGEANHARFWFFLTLQCYVLVMCAWIIDSSPYGLLPYLFSSHINDHHDGHNSWQLVLYVLLTRLYVYPVTLMAIVMWALHSVLACTNSTTYEFSKGPRRLEYLPPDTRLMDCPFAQGNPCRNLYNFIRRDAIWIKQHPRHSQWRPTFWQPPLPIQRDSEKWWEHPWQNKYWTCC